MTISSTNRKAGPFIGNGSASVFAFSFRVFAASDLEVVRITVATGVETTLTINSAYTVSLNADQNSNPGGSITLTGGALASGYNLIITSDIANLQPTDLTNQGGFYPEVITGALDRATIQIQQLDEHVNRTLSYPITDPFVGTELPPLEQRKGTVLAFDETTGAPEAGPSVGAILTVSGNIADINTVATNIASVNTTAGSIASVNTVAGSIGSVNTVSGINASVTAVAAINNKVVIAADNVADINNFADVYQGGKAADPTLRNDGTALQTGDLYFNTANDRMRVYETGTGWIDYEATAQAAATTATTQAGIATSAAATATTQATTATTQATAATNAKVAAELARDAAFVNAAVYVSTAAGLAATTNGQQFMVPVGDTITRYRNDTGVATAIAYYPAKAALDPLQRTNGAIFAVDDADGNLGLKIQSKFAVDSLGSVETAAFVQSSKTKKWSWAAADNDGNIAFGVDEQGRLVANFSLVPAAASYRSGGTYDYEVNHVFNYGQSLSVGQAKPVISTTQKYDNLMFVRGMRPQYDYPSETAAQWYASLVPAVEAQSPTQTILAETPSMGAGDSIKERILVEDGLAYNSISYQLLLSTPGYGATTIAQLSKGTTHYNRMVEQAQYGLALATTANKTYAVQAVTWTQGESDYVASTTQAAYVTAINTLVTDFNTDLKATTGQTKSIPLISYQVASHKVYSRTTPTIALAQLQVEGSNALVYIATPMYHFTYQSEGDAHLNSVSSRWLGAYYGLAYKRIVINGEDWKPLKPLSSTKQGKIAVIKFNVPKGQLVLDTTLVAANTNYGFELVDSVGTALSISSVSIVGPDTVKVVAAANIPTGAKLRYAWSGSGTSGSTSGPRGNLRDTQGDTIVFDPTGINKPMHNWCVIFEIGV